LVIQSFKIKWEGRKEIIEYEDDLTFGELESILSKTVDLSDVTKPKVNLPEYRQALLTRTLRKAPFPVGDFEAIKKLKSSIANEVLRGVLRSFPLSKFLEQWMGSFIGDEIKLKTEQITTTSSQTSSAGQKKK
tara:strand:- start:403 stop:801 length:399 start_codon:yes stop_codon:yes gene_type:complete